MILTIAVIASMLYTVVKNLDNPNLVIKSALGLFPCSHVIWNILCHVVIYQRLQVINMDIAFCVKIKLSLSMREFLSYLQSIQSSSI